MRENLGWKAIITLPREQANVLATAMSELFWPPADAVGLFAGESDGWRVEAMFSVRPAEDVFRNFIAEHTDRGAVVEFEDVPDADWVALSQARLHPIKTGRFFIHGSHDRPRARARLWAIEIDAGQAFGTAHHGSTRGCLAAIDALAKRKKFTNVLDLGTGTGVLAIAAARVWQGSVVASDIDPAATAIAADNVRRNNARPNVHAVTATGLNHPLIRKRAPFDLVIANILARPLITMAHDIAGALGPGGYAILSGITSQQAKRVVAAYGAAGFARCRRFTFAEWVTLTLRAR